MSASMTTRAGLLAPVAEKAVRTWLEAANYHPDFACFLWSAAVVAVSPGARLVAGAAWWRDDRQILGVEAWGCIPNPRDANAAEIDVTSVKDIRAAIAAGEGLDFNGHTWAVLVDGTLVDQHRRLADPADGFYYEVSGLARALAAGYAQPLRSLRRALARVTTRQ